MILEVDDAISLKLLEEKDADDIFCTIDSQRPYLGRWLPFVELTREQKDTETFIKAILEAPKENFEYVFTIRFKNEFAGLAGFRGTDKLNRKTEIGYWLSEPFQGLGIATRTVRRLCEFAFSDRGMNRIKICCAVGNMESRAIPKRLGFKYEGREREGELLSGGKYTDLEIYSLLNRESL